MNKSAIKDFLILMFLAISALAPAAFVGLVAFYLGKRKAIHLSVSVASGVLFMLAIVCALSLLSVFYNPLNNETWAHRVLAWMLIWPLLIFMYIFPPRSDAPSDGPTMEAILATIVVDVLVYSLLVYAFLWWHHKSRQNNHVGKDATIVPSIIK